MAMTTRDERNDVEDLLPWLAAGTLDERDTERAEAALAADPELARRYRDVREELAQTVMVNESLGAPSARVLQQLLAKIDAEPARRPAAPASVVMHLRKALFGLSPQTLAWSAAAAALIIVLQAGIIAGVVVREQATYQTASMPAGPSADGSYALIRFQPQASAADVTAFLEANRLDISSGPSAGGLYRVRISAGRLPKSDIERIIKTLATDKVVGFIAPTE
jgi:anti-sigma factor RsiW